MGIDIKNITDVDHLIKVSQDAEDTFSFDEFILDEITDRILGRISLKEIYKEQLKDYICVITDIKLPDKMKNIANEIIDIKSATWSSIKSDLTFILSRYNLYIANIYELPIKNKETLN